MKHLTLTSMLVLGLLMSGFGQTEAKEENIEARFYQEWLMTHDPKTGLIPRERLLDAARTARERRRTSHLRSGIIPIYWHERGPSNVGGRTRALLIDANDPSGKRVWAGSVSGGLWRTNDIDATSPVWVNINDYFSNLAITTLAQSPVNPNVMYFGTGEVGIYPKGDIPGGVRGLGIWRSIDGGANWQQIPDSIVGSNAINKIVIDNEGLVYAATKSGLFRSTNANGNLYVQEGPITGNVQDIEIAADGTIFAAFDTIGIYQFKNNTWTQLSVPISDKFGRIELATAPGNANIVYAAYAKRKMAETTCLNVFVTTNGGQTWTPRTCPADLGYICWYAYIMAVDPNDANRIWIGDINLFHSSDGGNNWKEIPNVHNDHHAIVYRSGNSNEVVFGNDGGVYRSTNAADMNPALSPKNNGYNVTQFYSSALHPTAGSNYMLGGTQDNYTQRFNCPEICETVDVTGGDGGFCFIDQDDPMIQITSSQNREFYLSKDGGISFPDLLGENKAAPFITPSDYDDAANILYFSDSSATFGRIDVTSASPSPTFEKIPDLIGSSVSCIKVSPNSPNRIWIGSSKGKILRIDDANQNGMIAITVLDSIFDTNVSCIEVEVGNDDHLLATTSNYGVAHIYETKDGGKTWTEVEGDLPDMPVRWAMFHPFDADQALIATELGVWTTDDLNGAKTEWFPTNTFGLANVRVDMLQYRSSDHLVSAASHGRGMYTTDYFNLLKTDCRPDTMIGGAVVSGLYIYKDFIESDGTIAAGESVIYHAGNFIRLKPNFRAVPGSFFVAAIQDCEMNLMEPPSLGNRPDQEEPTLDATPSLKCFPNPATYRMNIQINMPVENWYNLQVRTLDGRLVSTLTPGNRTARGEQWHELNTSDFQPGIYLLLLQSANGATTEKFVVVK